MTTVNVLLVVAAFLVGSLPMGLYVGRLRGVDLRRHGSGNIGATNAGRVLGRLWFFVVFALDFLKSFAPTVVARAFATGAIAPDRIGLAAGVAAVLGHVFSPFLRFHGGKGVAAAAGVFAALAPLPTAIGLAAWLAVFGATRFVSLASIAAAAALPAACWLLPAVTPVRVDRAVQWTALLVGALIVVRHQSNIARLVRGQEPRAGSSARDHA